MKPSFHPLIHYNNIQEIRLAHAIMESEYTVCIKPTDAHKFSRLDEVFGPKYRISKEECPPLDAFMISHRDPLTSIGSVQRPLIFPHAMFAHCRRQWPVHRTHRFSFAGLFTPVRMQVIQEWMHRNFQSDNSTIRLRASKSRPSLLRRLLSKTGLLHRVSKVFKPSVHRQQVGPVFFWASTRGRMFPDKAWDSEYYELLLNSQFVLCPSGDYVWTYRFFEAMICGAMPIIEEYTDVYEGFRFRTMAEAAEGLRWSIEDAEFNFRQCQERLTVPLELLNQELSALLNERT